MPRDLVPLDEHGTLWPGLARALGRAVLGILGSERRALAAGHMSASLCLRTAGVPAWKHRMDNCPAWY